MKQKYDEDMLSNAGMTVRSNPRIPPSPQNAP